MRNIIGEIVSVESQGQSVIITMVVDTKEKKDFVKKIPEMEFLSMRTYIQSENVVIAEMRITYTYVRYVVQCLMTLAEKTICVISVC